MSRALGAIPLTLISDIEFNMVIMVHGFESFLRYFSSCWVCSFNFQVRLRVVLNSVLSSTWTLYWAKASVWIVLCHWLSGPKCTHGIFFNSNLSSTLLLSMMEMQTLMNYNLLIRSIKQMGEHVITGLCDLRLRSAVLISRLKNTVGWFVVREKYCSS
jgi:hypothetical protein